MSSEWLDVRSASAYLGVSKQWIHANVLRVPADAAPIAYYDFGTGGKRFIKFKRADLDAFIAGRRVGASVP